MAVNKEFSFCHWASWRRQRGRGLPHNSRKHEMVISLNNHDVPAYKKLLNHWNSPFEDWYESEPARPRSAGGLMAGLVSSVCTNEWMEERRWADGWAGIECLYKWMDGGDNGGACLEPVGALWQCHISSSGSPAHTQPSTIHHTDHTQHCTAGRDVKKYLLCEF